MVAMNHCGLYVHPHHSIQYGHSEEIKNEMYPEKILKCEAKCGRISKNIEINS